MSMLRLNMTVPRLGGPLHKLGGQATRWRLPRRATGTLLAVTTAATLFLAAACGNTDTDSASGEHDVVKVTTFPTSVYLPVWVAIEQGLDEERGVRLQEIETAGGANLYTPLVGGQADTAEILPALTLSYADQGVIGRGTGDMAVPPGLAVEANEEHPATAIVVREGIDDVSELVGKTIATHNEVSGFYTLARATLADEGVEIDNNDPAAAHSTILPMGQMANALRLGKVDAGVMDYYSAMAAVADGAGEILMPVMGAGEWDQYPYAMWAFNREFYEEQPEAVVNFFLVILDANAWIIENPDEAKRLLVERMGTPEDLAKKFVDDFPMDGFRTDLNVDLSETPVPRLYGLLLEQGIIKDRKSLDEIYETDELVERAQDRWESE